MQILVYTVLTCEIYTFIQIIISSSSISISICILSKFSKEYDVLMYSHNDCFIDRNVIGYIIK